MLISVLASGSSGNCTFIKAGNANILIDLGMNNKYITERLAEINVLPSDITHVFVTHTHADHTGAMKVFFKRNNPIVYIAPEMIKELDFLRDYENLNYTFGDINLTDDVVVEMFRTSHDADASRGYIFKNNNESVVYITDTGYINQKLFPKLTNHTFYIFESNHDVEMLMHGPYPSWLKSRVGGDKGHLSNSQSGFYLSKLIGPDTKKICLAHLSHHNNTPDLALETIHNVLNNNDIKFDNFIIAEQSKRVDL